MEEMRIGRLLLLCCVLVCAPLYAADPPEALPEAAHGGDREKVRSMLKKGVSPDTLDKDGTPAIVWAARNDDVELVQLLLDSGANPNLQSSRGVTALQWACTRSDSITARLLLKHGADLNLADGKGRTALFSAVATNRKSLVVELLAAGAKIDATRSGNWTIVHEAVYCSDGKLDVTEALVKAGAKVNLADDATTTTPLHLAAIKGYAKLAAFLIKSGADKNAKDKEGRTPAELARANGHEMLAKDLDK